MLNLKYKYIKLNSWSVSGARRTSGLERDIVLIKFKDFADLAC